MRKVKKYGKASSYFKIGKQKADIDVPFWTPAQQTAQINRLQYYWKYHHFRNIFSNNFVLACHFYHAQNYSWRKNKLALGELGIKPAFIFPKIGREAIRGTISEPLKGALGEKVVWFHSKKNDPIGLDYEKMYKVLKLVLSTEKLFIIAGRIGKEIYYGEDFEEHILKRKTSPKEELAQVLSHLPHNLVAALCNHHVTRTVKALNWYLENGMPRRGEKNQQQQDGKA